MARYRRTRRYRRRSGRWASNISEFIEENITAPSSSQFFGTTDLVLNPVQSNTTTSQIYTIKNIEASFELETSSPQDAYQIESLAYYIMFVPQGMNVGDDYNLQHPEYIMAYKFYGSPTPDVDNTSNPGNFSYKIPLRVKTRLSRKLQTGDKVVLYIKGLNQRSQSIILHINGLVRWWTKAN